MWFSVLRCVFGEDIVAQNGTQTFEGAFFVGHGDQLPVIVFFMGNLLVMVGRTISCCLIHKSSAFAVSQRPTGLLEMSGNDPAEYRSLPLTP
jgi:hypothetical protein